MVNLNLNIQKKDLWLLSAILVFLVGVAYVIAIGSGDYAVHGHDVGEIEIQSIQAVGTTDISTNSLSWVDMPDMSVTMTTTGGAVLIMFSAPLIGQSSALDGYTRILIDGVEKRKISFYNVNYEGHHVYKFYDMQWLETGLSAGSHIFKIQWKEGGVHAPANALLQNGATYRRVLTVIEI